MNILGITAGFPGLGGIGHDPAAAIIQDGRVIACAEEERFVRVKHALNYFPVSAIKFCLKQAGVGITDVDYILYYMDPSLGKKAALKPTKMLRKPLDSVKFFSYWHICKERVLNSFKEHFHELDVSKIKFMEHHLAHAASAYRASGFKKAVILTIDYIGEYTTALLASANGGEIEKIHEITMPNTLGGIYAAATKYLGFKPNNDEYKVMGLAAYGKPIYSLDDVIVLVDGKPDFRLTKDFKKSALLPFFFVEQFAKRYGAPRLPGEKITERHKNIAASIQRKTEEVVLRLLSYLHEITGYKNLCLAGGVALNVKMNSVLLRSHYVDNIFVQPAANDAGCALGAALELYYQITGENKYEMTNAYLGPEYTDDEILSLLKEAKIGYEKYSDITGVASELLAKGRIIGWFQGKMEWGPRALGNRSILADPQNPKMKDLINYYVKHREPWRPFAPSIIAEEADRYLIDAYPSPYMLLTFSVKADKRREIAATVHVDGTSRPQTVEETENQKYYRLIRNFEKQTGIPAILNTSFNIRGEPIVNSPRDALRTFFSTGMDYLILGDFLVKKD